MRNPILSSIFFLFLVTCAKAQFNFEHSDSIEVKNGTQTLDLAWAGGLSYAQFSDIDFDFDGDLDLFVFDRSSDNIRIFLQVEINGVKQYKVQQNAHLFFPQDIRYRATAKDYDNDGRNDLFVYGIGGIKVYRNVGDASSGLQWVLAKNLLYSDYSGAQYNLYVSSADIPAIVDVDGDSDLDILTFHIGGEHMQYHQNQSMELYGTADSLIFVLKNECWGGFREDINTSSVYLNDQTLPCTTGNVTNPELPEGTGSFSKPTEALPKHSGSTVLAIDIDNSGVLDLILGDVSFPNLNLLINGGSSPNTNSVMVSSDNSFPANSQPANMHLFPASFYVDVDFDGKKDLIVGANAKNISENETSILYYKNFGSNTSPIFIYQTNAFLQNEMIEHGMGTIPVFFDFDQDGLEDLFVSNFYRYKPTLNKESSIAYYKNTGTATNPVYTFIDADFLNLSQSTFGLRMVPTFGDLDSDGDKDLLLGLENGTLVYFQNTSSTPPTMTFAAPIPNFTDNLGNTISSGQYASPQLFDLNEDGLLDLIIGKKTGELLYYQNIGTAAVPSFELTNNLLGNIDIATTSPDGFPHPHFFKHNDTLSLFLGGIDGNLHYYTDIESNISAGNSFTLVSANFLNLKGGAYSSFWVNDPDNDGLLNLFVGQDLGGLFHLEVDTNSNASTTELQKPSEITLYPNPTTGLITVFTGEIGTTNYKITDITGKQILAEQLNTTTFQIDISEQSAGIYLLVVQTENGNFSVNRILKK